MEVKINNNTFTINLVSEVKRNPNKRGYIYDHIKDDGTEFKKSSTYLMDNYGITYIEYVSLLTGGDLNYRGSCNECNKPVFNLNNLGVAFRLFCGKSCSARFTTRVKSTEGTHPWQSGNFDESIRDRQRLLANEKTRQMAKDGTHPFYNLSNESVTKSRKKTAATKSSKGINGFQINRVQIETAYPTHGTLS